MTRPPDIRTLLSHTPAGLYCAAGDFHIDPLRPVSRALITHAHADHARPGHGAVLATRETLDIMAIRCGQNFCREQQTAAYGEQLTIGDTHIAFHPAGHVLGSAQIAISHRAGGGKIVFSGDYKRAADPTCAAFEPVRCDIFITEATFGLPVFNHPDPAMETGKLLRSLDLFPGRAHLVGVYALGKGQRLAALLREAGYDRPLHVHGALEKLMDYYQSRGVNLGSWRKIEAADRAALAGEIILCPPSAHATPWAAKFPDPLCALASGWMRVRARARQRGAELPLVISDHAGWDELCATIVETGCEEVWITHGEADALMRWAQLRQLRAKPLHLAGYGDEADDDPDALS